MLRSLVTATLIDSQGPRPKPNELPVVDVAVTRVAVVVIDAGDGEDVPPRFSQQRICGPKTSLKEALSPSRHLIRTEESGEEMEASSSRAHGRAGGCRALGRL